MAANPAVAISADLDIEPTERAAGPDQCDSRHEAFSTVHRCSLLRDHDLPHRCEHASWAK